MQVVKSGERRTSVGRVDILPVDGSRGSIDKGRDRKGERRACLEKNAEREGKVYFYAGAKVKRVTIV